jgi:hypothetical protein
MFWIWAILGAIAYATVAGAIVLFLYAARRVRKRYERMYLQSMESRRLPLKKRKTA